MHPCLAYPSAGRLARRLAGLAAALFAAAAQAATPGITGTGGTGGTGASFDLVAAPGYVSQPDGTSIYSWGYGCNTAPASGQFAPAAITKGTCAAGKMQLPGPTLIVTEGDSVTVTLHNNLPKAAGNTSILFPGMDVSASGGSAGLLTQEAANGGTVTYTFTARLPGTHSYFSGTQGDLQVEMGLYGALIVLPRTQANSAACANPAMRQAQVFDRGSGTPGDFRLANALYDNAQACYDREYLFQFSEIDPTIHRQALEQVTRFAGCTQPTGCMVINTEPYHAVYFLINGRSMPDIGDPNYAPQYPAQPYNGNPHMHPGEYTLVRVVGQGRMQHPFHKHGNHVRVLARDGNPILSKADGSGAPDLVNGKLAGPLLFTTTTTPGQTVDVLFQWTAKGLGWDVYAHTSDTPDSTAVEGGGGAPCVPDANGFYTADPTAPNFYEWCADHKKPLEAKPFGTVGAGGPVTLPDPNITALGAWYSGSPYMGPDANARSVGLTPIPPFGTIANDPGSEAGFAYMWHSHNEREITTNNVFPGGMMMMMLVDPWVFLIDETN
ncbi:MAG: multicopper oxidase family protein [Rubrivivax sp.]